LGEKKKSKMGGIVNLGAVAVVYSNGSCILWNMSVYVRACVISVLNIVYSVKHECLVILWAEFMQAL